MTLDEITASDEPFLNAQDVSDLLHCDPHAIRVQAQSDPDLIGFPVSVIGKRVRIPRIPFLRFIGKEESA